ncbi:hypothetical protein, partial [Enterobacter hormaechei]|uniref:hypothetical protein n=1 Tax=Enterobacter hormaechei TaxID=158836 RepID=UPI0021486367
MSAHSGITVFGMAEDGQKNGTPIGGAPAPKPRFLEKQLHIVKSVKILPPRHRGGELMAVIGY